ncbi:MAG: peptide ABC transporter substrate-binding protein [Anaerolineales bacterium]|nr:peptide ABC transporter substrate-binding protein [Anaerolineales bacterium]
MSLLVLASMILAACGGGQTPTQAVTEEPAAPPTEAPATQAPTEPPAAYEGMKVEAPSCDYGGGMKSIEAVDEFTVKLTLCAPDPAVPAKVAFSSLGIQPSEYLESTGGSGDLLEKPIGTGPYKLEAWERGNQIVFTRNDAYWGEPAKTPTLVFRWGSESAQRLLELQNGAVDAIDNVGPDDFGTVEGDSSLKLMPRPALNVMYIGMTNTFAPFDNELVRQAFAQAIDRQRIVDNFYPAGSEVASHFTPCSIPNGCAGESWYDFNPEAAKALLAEAGYSASNPFPSVKLSYRNVVRGYLPDPVIVAQDIQAQLKENLGVTVEINEMESGAFLDAANSGALDGMHLLGWGADFPDVVNFLDAHFSAAAFNQFGTPFDDITDNLTKGGQLAAEADREPFYAAANDAIKKHVPMIPVAHGGSAIAYKAAVEGAHASPLSTEIFAVMGIPGQDTFVWMQNAEPISLYCADETDGESLRACEQVTEPLLSYQIGGTATETGGLAESFEANDDLTEWTFHLRQGVTFHDGSALDANDVVLSYVVQWDAAHPLHKGNTGAFEYWTYLFGAFLNAPQ